MKHTDVVRDLSENLSEGQGIERRAIGRDAEKGQVACRQGRVQTPQKRPDVVVRGIVIQDVIEDTLVAAIIDCGKNAEGTIIEFIGGHIPRKISQRPVQEVRVHARLRLFSPPPRPSSGSWQKGQRHDGRARGANSLGGRARRPRPRAGPPDQSPDGCTDRRGTPDRRGPRESTCDTSYSSAANR